MQNLNFIMSQFPKQSRWKEYPHENNTRTTKVWENVVQTRLGGEFWAFDVITHKTYSISLCPVFSAPPPFRTAYFQWTPYCYSGEAGKQQWPGHVTHKCPGRAGHWISACPDIQCTAPPRTAHSEQTSTPTGPPIVTQRRLANLNGLIMWPTDSLNTLILFV